MQSVGIGPRRTVVPRRDPPKQPNLNTQSVSNAKNCKKDNLQTQRLRSSVPKSEDMVFVSGDNQEDSITPPSEGVTTVNAHDVNIKPFNIQRDPPALSSTPQINDKVASLGVGPGNVQRKVHFSSDAIATSRGKCYFYLLSNASFRYILLHINH